MTPFDQFLALAAALATASILWRSRRRRSARQPITPSSLHPRRSQHPQSPVTRL